VKVSRREALQRGDTPYGSVGVVHDGADLQAWWIWKDEEAIDPDWNALEREDLLYVIKRTLRLELEGEPPRDLARDECFVAIALLLARRDGHAARARVGSLIGPRL